MRWIWAACLVLSSTTTLACPQPDCVRIGSWNIEWLGSDKRHQPVDAKTIDRMARMIAEDWSIDVITLQEINTELEGYHRGGNYSLAPWQKLQTALEQRGYHTIAGSSGNAQHLVMAWRPPARVLEKPRDLPVRDRFDINEYCRSSNLRKPLAGLFRAGQFDFWLVGLHLKANSGQTACTSAVRHEQAQDLADALAVLGKKDRDIVLAGDFNASPQHDSLKVLRAAGMDPISTKSHRHRNSQHISHIGNQARKPGSGSQLDHIMVSPSHTQEWQAGSTRIHNPEDLGAFESRYSDHLPIWADFSTKRDDD